MLKDEIQSLKKKLNESIEKEDDFADIYKISIELDKLIYKYYMEIIEKNAH